MSLWLLRCHLLQVVLQEPGPTAGRSGLCQSPFPCAVPSLGSCISAAPCVVKAVIPAAFWKGYPTCAFQSSLWELQGQPWVVFYSFCDLSIHTPPLIIRSPFLGITVPLCSALNTWAWIYPVVLNISPFFYLPPTLSSCFSPNSFSPQLILRHVPPR